jgi:pimeloyl-ACP methyl ester carboxylesterase/DNA-binding SARP family transcriptional activator
MTVLHRGSSTIFYKREPGDAEPDAEQLVFVHGNRTTHTCFDLIVPLLNTRFPIIRYDLRGFGQSDPGDAPLSLEAYCDDLLHLVRTLGLRSFHLIGYGFGAIVAARFTVLHPESVKSVVLISLPFSPDSSAVNNLDYLETPSSKGTVDSVDRFADLMTSLPPGHPIHGKIDFAAPPSTCHWITELSMRYQPMDDLERLAVPTLLLCGEEENSSPVFLSLMAAFCLSEYKLYTVPDSAYMVVLDQPGLTATWLANFIGKLGRKPCSEEAKPKSRNMQQYMKQLIKIGEAAVASGDELRVELLEGFHVYANGIEIKGGWNQRFAKNIFLYLLLHRTVSRDQLCETLWPNLPLGKARSYLRVYLSHLKKLLEPSNRVPAFLIMEREDVSLYGRIVCDALDFVQEITIASQEEDDRKKLALCRKIFHTLPVTFFQSLYDDWFLVMREEWEHNLESLAVWMADYFIRQGNPQEASVHLKHMLRILPKNETLVDKLIVCYERSKDEPSKEYWEKQKDLFDAS